MKERIENTLESEYTTFNLLSGPLYASDVESSIKSQDSQDSSSLGRGDTAADTWSVQSFEAYDCREAVWSSKLFTPIKQSMVDLVLISKEPFVEVVLNLLAKCRVFTTKEKTRADLLMRRLLVSGAVELLANFNGNHDCQVSASYIQNVIMDFFWTHDLVLPAYDYMKDFSLEPSGGKVVQQLELPSWASIIVLFMALLKTKSRKVMYELSLKNLELLSETCQSPLVLQFPVFLTMLFAPNKKLQDFIELDVSNIPNVEVEE